MVTSSSQDPLGVVTESSGRGFREGLINLTTANPATLNFLVTIFMAAHCGTRGGGFAQSRPWAAFSRPTWENFTFCQLLTAFFPIFPNVDYLIHASARVLCCNWGMSSFTQPHAIPAQNVLERQNFFFEIFLRLKLSEWSTSFLLI